MASQTETAWLALFDALDLGRQIEQHGFVKVTADQIKDVGCREPRLMTKFDTRESRPDRIKKAGCTVLPITNGTYVLVRGDGYEDLPSRPLAERITTQALDHLQTLHKFCDSEAQVLEVAHTCGLIERFVGESVQRTTQGRNRASFSFRFIGDRDFEFDVDGVQVEVDGCFEASRVYVFEAKIGSRDNFHARQLYYPLRMWRTKRVTKPIVPVFVTYSDHTFTFFEFRVDDENVYNSLQLVATASYVIDSGGPPKSLRELLAQTQPAASETSAPFPQANDVRKVIDVIDAVAIGIASKARLTDLYGFATRQASYYGDAARYLGFLDLIENGYALTDAGRSFSKMSAGERVNAIGRSMLASPVFRGVAARVASTGLPTDSAFVADLIARQRLELTGTTPRRRAQTVQQWLLWLTESLATTD